MRRKLHEARDQSPKLSGCFLRQIQHLYRVESRLREKKAGANQRAALRAAESRMVVQRFHRALVHLRSKVLPKSLLRIAISYAMGRWVGMPVDLDVSVTCSAGMHGGA